MKNKKLLKALAALTMGAAAAGCVSLFGCAHTHTFKDEWKNDDPSGHWHEATCEHTDEKDGFGVHVDEDNDNLCDVCGYRMAPDTVAVEGIKLNKSEAAVDVGGTVTLTATVSPDNATDKTVTWTSSDETKATVAGGVVTGVAEGEVTITATAGGKSATCTVTVSVPVSGVTLDKSEATVDVGETVTLTAAVSPDNATDKTVTWTSSDETKATVAGGVVTGVAEGEVTITATAGGKSATCTVTVSVPVTAFTVTFHMKGHGTQIDAVTVNKNDKVTKPTDPSDGNWNFAGWFTDEACETPYNFNSAVTDDLNLYALWDHEHDYDTAKWAYDAVNHYHVCKHEGCGKQIDVGQHTLNDDKECTVCHARFQEMTYEIIPTKLDTTTYNNGISVGIFSILPNTKVRDRARLNYNVYDYKNGEGTSADTPVDTGFSASKSIQMDGSKLGMSVNAIAPGTLTIYLDNGSGGKTKKDKQSILFTRPDGTTETIYYFCGDMYAISFDCDVVGTYTITRGSAAGVGTSDIYYAKFETVVPVTAVEKIQIAEEGTVVYIEGQEFDSGKLQVQAVRETTGMIEPVDLTGDNVTIDSSAFDKTQAGTYKIVVTYKDENNNEFKAEYEVKVYAVEKLQLGFNSIIQGANTSAGNGTYVNHTVQQFYFKGQELDLDGLTVRTVFDNNKQNFIVKEGFTVTGYNKDVAGKQTVTVTWNGSDISAEFNVYVADYSVSSIQTTAENITLNVNPALEDANVGTLDNGAYRFKTIQQALDFLEAVNFGENTKKVINLAEGTYNEKLEINVPNLTIKGANTDATKTIIEWDSLYGIEDEGGFIHTTDSTATLNVREGAVGFVIEDVTVSNWYNSTEHFDEALGPDYPEHRALAVLIQADKVVMDNVRMLGYQDTLELFTGRQIIKNSYINGRTDFIFGTNNTTYFYNCEIESIVSGGYVTAFKGCNKGSGDYVNYGAIFDKCKFTAPEDVISAADTSLGRTWGAYAAVAYVNCEFAGHVSTKAYGDGKGTRYTAMSGAEPTDATVKFVEYNNTGAGAVTTAVAGMKLLTAAEAANYSDFSVIFGTTNGGVTYSAAWDGSKGVTITEKTYKFTAEAFPAGDVSATDADAETEIFNGDIIVHGAWNTELTTAAKPGKDFGWFPAGTTIEFNVPGKVTFTMYSGYGSADNLEIMYANGKALVTVVATSSVTKICVTGIIVDSSEEPEHEHVYGEWVVSEDNLPTTEATGKAVKTCIYCESDPAHSVEVVLPELSEDNYTITAGTTSGKATYTFTTDGGDEISFEADKLAGVHTHDYTAWEITATLESSGTATKTCTVEGCPDAEKTIIVNLPQLTDSSYTITNNTATLAAGGRGTYSIEIDGETITFEADTPALTLNEIATETLISFGTAGNYKTALVNSTLIAEFAANGNIRDNGGNNSQLSGTTLNIKVKAGAIITIASYSGYTHYQVKIDGTDYGTEQTGTSWEYTAENDCTISFVSTETDNYFYSISVSYGFLISEHTKITFGNKGNSTTQIDGVKISCTNSPNGDNDSQLKNGNITLNVKAGAKIHISGNYSVDYTINDTAVKSANAGGTDPLEYDYIVEEDGEVVIVVDPNSQGKNYFYFIEITFEAES